jgi:glycosyltransferase involved in cell wall biosynthesis
MKQICIGIPVTEQPAQLHATLASLRLNTIPTVQVILLPDGPDVQSRQALQSLSNLPQFTSETPLGTAASFNRLATSSDAEILVLLESGVQVGPGWLDQLLAALDLDPRNGLAGPSTNNSWNEQGVFPNSGSSSKEIEYAATMAAQRFGHEARTLEPLYSLADFCYVVRREVVEAIGGADEDYGLGPCWEMDYNIRAARAGWRGVWAGAAYVHRAPFTARRRLEEARRFEASKRHYQNRFCGRRLRGESSGYRQHCSGDACPNFAPAALIELKRPLSTPPATLVPLPEVGPQVFATPHPLVSCIMPTSNRRSYVPQAIRCFLRQDYANLELVIVDDGTDSVADCVPENERIRYIRLDRKLTLGAKRNFACEQSRGDFIVHWDDDDWYPSWRVSRQVAALSDGGFDLCGSSRVSYLDAETDQAWEYRYAAARPAWVAGNTLAYRKSFWNRNRFPEIQVGEDSRFVWSSANKSICDLAEPGLCIATVHPGNTSRKDVNGSYWHAQSSAGLRSMLGDDVHFYRVATDTNKSAWPLVSCIMPTYNRRQFIPQALQHFIRQDYPNRELIIVDDGRDAIGDLANGLPNVRYLRLSSRASIGAKRNLACQHAQGQLIAHWDDDDWYSSDRLRYQVAPILADKADITGLENAFVLELPAGEFWKTNSQLHQQLFIGNVHGGTLVYRKELLEQGLRYPEINLAEDAHLLYYALKRGKRLLRLSNPGVFVYVRHGSNAWRDFTPGRFLNPSGWTRIEQPPVFPAAALASYKAAALASYKAPALVT